MNKIDVLERLVSIKSNAQERAGRELEYLGHQNEVKAFILENGIEQLIIEIQNAVLAEYQTAKVHSGQLYNPQIFEGSFQIHGR